MLMPSALNRVEIKRVDLEERPSVMTITNLGTFRRVSKFT